MLIMVGGLVVISGLFQTINNDRAARLPEFTVATFNEQQARNISTSLIDNAIQKLVDDNDWEGSIPTDNYFRGAGVLYTYTQGNSGLDSIDHSVVEWNEYKVLLISRATYENYSVETEVLMQRDSFSKFSYFTDQEPMIWFVDGDVINGPVHTNGTFHMKGAPVFNGFISSPNMWEAHGSGASPVFNGGSNFSLSNTRDLPDSQQLNLITAAAASSGLVFSEDMDIEFYMDGDDGYVRASTHGCSDASCVEEYLLSDYDQGEGVIISVDGDVDVVGTLKGKVTLHATDDIEIMGDIYYNTDPRVDSTSTDLLGLVSEGDVKVDQNAHSYNGSQDLTIHSSIMALGTSFEVENYSTGSFKGDLNILGGIVQKTRGAVGTFGGYYGTTGYSKKYEYDDRLLHTIPPSFPRESIFSIVYWKDKMVEVSD